LIISKETTRVAREEDSSQEAFMEATRAEGQLEEEAWAEEASRTRIDLDSRLTLIQRGKISRDFLKKTGRRTGKV
jgi:hypothetical protein